MVFKSLYGMVPEYLTLKFNRHEKTAYNLRDSSNKLAVSFPRRNYLKNSFSYRWAVFRNSLPYDLGHAESLNSFLQLFETHFVRNFTFKLLYFDALNSWKAGFYSTFLYVSNLYV